MKAYCKAEAVGRYWVAIEYETGATEYDGRVYETPDEAERRALRLSSQSGIREVFICTI